MFIFEIGAVGGVSGGGSSSSSVQSADAQLRAMVEEAVRKQAEEARKAAEEAARKQAEIEAKRKAEEAAAKKAEEETAKQMNRPGDGDLNEDKKVDEKDLDKMFDTTEYGDMDHDGKIDKKDFEALNKKILDQLFKQPEIQPLDEAEKHVRIDSQGDVNRDGKIDYKDLQQMYDVMKHGDMDGNRVLDMHDLYKLREKIKAQTPPPPPPPLLPPVELTPPSVVTPQPAPVASAPSERPSHIIQPPPPPPPPPHEGPDGDVNENGKTNKKDLRLLKQVLKRGDVNKDGVVDRKDFDLINQLILKELSGGLTREEEQQLKDKVGDVNDDGKVDYKDLQLMKQAMNHADMNENGQIDEEDVRLLAEKVGDPGDDEENLKQIDELSKTVLEDPYHNFLKMDDLARVLGKQTDTEYSLGKSVGLMNFVLNDRQDLTGDGKIDSKDILAFWEKKGSGEEEVSASITQPTKNKDLQATVNV